MAKVTSTNSIGQSKLVYQVTLATVLPHKLTTTHYYIGN